MASPPASNDLTVYVENYRVTRHLPDPTKPEEACYTVYRKDGTKCCTGVSWSDVEQVIADDHSKESDG